MSRSMVDNRSYFKRRTLTRTGRPEKGSMLVYLYGRAAMINDIYITFHATSFVSIVSFGSTY